MEYAIIIHETPVDFAKREDARAEAYFAGWKAYHNALLEAGIFKGGAALQAGPTSTTLRIVDGKRHVQDGPYADTKEQLGGFILIDVADLDAALKWAALCPAATSGAVEVRPVRAMH